jgi:glycosyltransferase involved in cell wall biosynthesis
MPYQRKTRVGHLPHLLLFVEDFLPAHKLAGGVRISVYEQVRYLAQAWRVTVVAPYALMPPLARYAKARRIHAEARAARREPFDLPGVKVLRPPYIHVPLLFMITEPLQLLLIGLWVWLRHARDARIIHGHRTYPMGLTAVLVGRATGRPAVTTAHGSGLHTDALNGSWRTRSLIGMTLRHADRLVVVSRDLFAIARRLGVDEHRIRYVPNGVDLEAFAAGDRQRARRDLGLPADGRVIVSVGFLDPVKAHSVLIESFRRLCGKRSDVTLVIAGSGPLRAALEEQIRSSGLSGHARLLGAVPYMQVPDLLAAADVVALPSWNEGMPLAALEALAAGRPLVGSAVGGTRDVVDQDRHGLLVPAGDVEALAGALDAALKREWDPAFLRARAQQYSWKNIVDELLRVYGELAGTAAPPPVTAAEA